ncbi:MAG: anaerobic ribonucleoside-triphosphate reductase activating protein [Oscillospiraceae bacterium]|nr:anaerobic ribonucleoside-triphosphate reductase activating protein [Oscillospiraceae bacterium]
MRISGLMKLTLLDFPGHTACTVFTGGCNYRCPFCHNAELVLRPSAQPEIPEAEFFALLKKRRGLLDGVAVTGGEPTLQPDLPDFLRRIRDLGYAVKLDTNGTRPDLLRRLVEEGLVQYVAMDIKNAPDRYGETAGVEDPRLDMIRASAAFLLEGTVPYEFRTTAVRELHRPEDLREIGRWLRGAERYFIQCFADSGDLIEAGLHPCSREELELLLEAVRPFIPAAELRGAD